MEKKDKQMDYTEFGTPAPEWQRFVAVHPEEGVAASLREDESDSELQFETNAERHYRSESSVHAWGLDASVRVDEVDVREIGQDPRDGLTARVYTRVQREDDLQLDRVPGVVYYHGGGYVFGGPDTERYLCSLMASKLRVVVVHVCYREAPQHPHPAAHRDGKDGFEWVFEQAPSLGIDPEQIVVVGLSCGAGIAASTTLRICNEDAEKHGEDVVSPRAHAGSRSSDAKAAGQELDGEADGCDDVLPDHKVVDRAAPFAGRRRSKRRIKGLVLGLPWLLQESSFPYHLFSSREATSRVQCAQAPGMSKAVYDRLVDMLGAQDPSDPLLNVPLETDEELARFPRTAFIVAGMDLFRDDALILAERLRVLG